MLNRNSNKVNILATKYKFTCPIIIICVFLIFSLATFKRTLYAIEPSTRNGKIWPTCERQHHQYVKISCWRWRCCTAEWWTKLRQLTRQACRVITVVAIFNSWLLKVILDSAVVETSVIDWKRVARVRVWFKRQQDIFRYWRCCLLAGRPNFAVMSGRFNPIQWLFNMYVCFHNNIQKMISWIVAV